MVPLDERSRGRSCPTAKNVILSAAIAFCEANAIAESKDPYCANDYRRSEYVGAGSELAERNPFAAMNVNGIGVLRLRRTIRFANRPAPLRMTIQEGVLKASA
jgi:hypothetical protein